ncbi:MAG: multifunctional CCA addition/repair protein [Pseudomonadota bacterium]
MDAATDKLEVYLVGGAVRDALLGLEVHERDWVVVGATPDELTARGFRQVGNDFPVFLHPDTNEEYALARTERKTAPGHGGFEFDTEARVTLEEDLERRDLTINAIAQRPDGTLVDPYGGSNDLEQRVLRHVSDAFTEDPLRVLRVARFATRLAPLGFDIDVDTMRLMAEISAAGELETLSPERVLSETERALGHDRPSVYVRILRACGALGVLFPEVDALFGVPQPAQWHPEVDTGLHTLMVIDAAANMGAGTDVRFAALVHDLGKALTPESEWPRHHGHEARSVPLVKALCERLRVPKRWQRLAEHVAEYHTHCHRALDLRPKTAVKVLEAVGAFRDREHFERVLQTCEADARGRDGLEDRPYPQVDYLRGACDAAAAVDTAAIAAQGHEGKAFGEALRRERVTAVADYRRRYTESSSK